MFIKREFLKLVCCCYYISWDTVYVHFDTFVDYLIKKLTRKKSNKQLPASTRNVETPIGISCIWRVKSTCILLTLFHTNSQVILLTTRSPSWSLNSDTLWPGRSADTTSIGRCRAVHRHCVYKIPRGISIGKCGWDIMVLQTIVIQDCGTSSPWGILISNS